MFQKVGELLMTGNCRNICERMKTKSIRATRLEEGWKKCRTCEISIKTDSVACPCCKTSLSVRKRHNYKNRRNRIECV